MRIPGSRGEDIAAIYLEKNGYKVLCRNYKTPLGEADIIVKQKNTVVFVEVKARANDFFGQPFEAVDHRKQERLKRVALYYLKQNKIETPVRFDIISIILMDGKETVNHIIEAF
ncbi:YraN family protein [Thermodesulfovibrionales bacterium]|nr:YraN family protein [Thermodesulfovibrionales bacterium]MCL0061955.1 YraN family protein [Thermodesulfovibrionales bacterium]MCL0096705.1 YraN family protein [Thermodesulfovibrionales bacterium]